jgi:dTDP-4-dehydrorhamnose reductase
VLATSRNTLDVTCADAIAGYFERFRPDLVVHLAAWTDVDGCELDSARANAIHHEGTRTMAEHCRTWNTKLVYVSTLAVFDGLKCTPYVESDTPNACNVYGRTKLAGELAVAALVPRHFIVRAGWLFGGFERDRKFVGKVLRQVAESDSLRAVVDKFGSPTHTKDLANAIYHLSSTERYGTYHAVNNGKPASRFELALAVIEFAGLKSHRVLPALSIEFALIAPRPRMEAGLNERLAALGLLRMRPWREALAEYVGAYINESRRLPSRSDVHNLASL